MATAPGPDASVHGPCPRRPNLARQKSGRRVVMTMIGLFLTGQLLIGYFLDQYGTSIRFPSAVGVWREAERGPRPDLIWLGSSRTAFSIRHDVMNHALWGRHGHQQVNLFNGALPYGDPLAMEFVLDGLLQRGQQPEVLILEMAPEFLSQDAAFSGVYAHRQGRWADIPGLLPRIFQTNVGRVALSRLLPLYEHREQLRMQLIGQVSAFFTGEDAGPMNTYQPGGVYGSAFSDPPGIPEELIRSRSRLPRDTRTFGRLFKDYQPNNGLAAAALERIFERCERENISVVLVLPPAVENVRDLFTPEFEQRFQEYLAGLRHRHDFVVHDLRACIPDAGFYDMYHLNAEGSILYSHLALEGVVLPCAERVVSRSKAARSLSCGE